MKKHFSVSELIAINSPDLPKTTQAITRRAHKEGWRKRDGMSIKATGKTGGGGYLYHISLFSEITQDLLAIAYQADRDKTTTVQKATCDLWARYNALPSKQKKICEERLNALQTYLNYRKSGYSKTISIARCSQDCGIAERTIHAWLALVSRHRRSDWLATLIPSYVKTARRQEYNNEAYDLVKSDYLRPEKPSFSKCYRRMLTVAKKLNWTPIPNERAMRRHFNQDVPKAVQTLARSGRDTAKTLYPAQRRTRSHLHAMQYITMDGHKFDVFIRVPGQKKPTRVILMAAQDLFSGKFVGWRIALSENKDAVRLTIGDMVQKYGIPDRAYLDNGRAFTAKAITGGIKNRYRFKPIEGELTGLMVSLGIEIKWTKPFSGQSKPIERAFGDLADAISKHPICAGAYTGNKPEAKPENYGNCAIPLDDFQRLVDEQIHEHNARVGRRGNDLKGRSFDQTFEQSLADPSTIVRWASKEQRALWLMAAERVRCRKGSGEVIIFDNRYWSKELNPLAGKDVTVRYDQQDLTQPVLIYDHDDKLICEAPLVADTKFDDVDAAREHGRDRNEMMKAVRTQRDLHRKFSPNQLADFYTGKLKPTDDSKKTCQKATRITTKKKVTNGPDQVWEDGMNEAFSRGIDALKADNVLNVSDFDEDTKK